MRGSAVFRTGVAPGGALAGPWVRNPLWTRARAVPSLDLRFADNKSLVDAVTGAQLVTFTRASSGTFVGSDGVLRTAVTNLCLQSENFTTTWTNFLSTDAANTAIAPNGTLTADTLIPDSGATAGLIRQDFSGATFTDNASISFSIYVKAAGLTNFNIQFYNKANTFHGGQTVNASTGALSGVGTLASTAVTSIGDGWYRVSMTGMSSGTGATGPNLRIVVTSTGDGTSGLFLWGAQLEQSSTVGEYIPTTSAINSAPRFDHNPTTGESLGLLVEEARTNSIANNTGVGAVAGAPGTLPTNWTWNTAGGASTEVVGTGTENGIAYVDVRLFGTLSSSPSIQFVANTAIAATTGQTWTESFYCKIISLVSGTPDPRLRIIERSVAGSYLTEGNQSFTPGISSASLIASRFTFTRTLVNALTGYAIPALLFGQASGAIDVTLRIGLPQLEQGAFATSPILTSTAAATRSADVASIGSSAFSGWYRQDEGTFYTENQLLPGNLAAGFPGVFSVNNGSGTNQIMVYWLNSTSPQLYVRESGTITAGVNGVVIAGSLARIAGRYATNDAAISANGSTVQSDTSVVLPTPDRLQIGAQAGSALNSGHIRRLSFWPTRLPNSTLQAITG